VSFQLKPSFLLSFLAFYDYQLLVFIFEKDFLPFLQLALLSQEFVSHLASFEEFLEEFYLVSFLILKAFPIELFLLQLVSFKRLLSFLEPFEFELVLFLFSKQVLAMLFLL